MVNGWVTVFWVINNNYLFDVRGTSKIKIECWKGWASVCVMFECVALTKFSKFARSFDTYRDFIHPNRVWRFVRMWPSPKRGKN